MSLSETGKKISKLSVLAITAGAGLLLSACDHKDVYLQDDSRAKIKVVFDWRDAPDADPASMVLYLYATDGEGSVRSGQPLRYVFSGKDGGEITLPSGIYDAICVNGDNTDWASISHIEKNTDALIASTEVDGHSPYGELAAVINSKPESADGNKLINPPSSTWVGSHDAFDARYDGKDKTLVIYPQDPICHYTVDIYDVEGMEQRSTMTVPATLSNMSDGVSIFSAIPSTNRHAIPFYLQKGKTQNSLHGEFLTFGEDAPSIPTHHMSLYTKMDDGSWAVQTNDVTDQVHGATDPKHVHIVLRGAKIPHTTQEGFGLKVNVNGWESEIIPLKM